MPEKIHADVPLSFFEYRAIHQEPIFDLQGFSSEVLRSVFGAFRSFNVSLENVSYKQNPLNFGEVGTTFVLFGGKLAFTVGLGSTVMAVHNPNWSELGLITSVAKAGMAAVLSGGSVRLERQRATLGIHLKPASGSMKDLVSTLAQPTVTDFIGSDVRGYGISVYREDSVWVVDASVSYPDALFVRIDRILAPNVPFEEIASKLMNDELRLLELLRLEVE